MYIQVWFNIFIHLQKNVPTKHNTLVKHGVLPCPCFKVSTDLLLLVLFLVLCPGLQSKDYTDEKLSRQMDLFLRLISKSEVIKVMTEKHQ